MIITKLITSLLSSIETLFFLILNPLSLLLLLLLLLSISSLSYSILVRLIHFVMPYLNHIVNFQKISPTIPSPLYQYHHHQQQHRQQHHHHQQQQQQQQHRQHHHHHHLMIVSLQQLHLYLILLIQSPNPSHFHPLPSLQKNKPVSSKKTNSSKQ